MKVTVLPFIVAAFGLATQVSAGPIRIYVLAPENTDVTQPDVIASPPVDAPVAHMRWGLAAAGAPQSATQPWMKMMMMGDANRTDEEKPVRKHRCAGAMRMKAIGFSNWLREKVGLEPITTPPHHLHFPHGRPMPHRPEEINGGAKIIWTSSFHGSAQSDGEDKAVDGRPPYHHHHFHAHHHHQRPATFTGRVQRALMTLGPWEGRFVAFVIGCGIGSLLRMFYILCVVAYRSFGSRKDEEEPEVIFTEVEEVPPPKYIADQKVVVGDDKTSA